MRYASLFTGVGGLDLGLDRAGWSCLAQVEQNPYRRAVLARHWPEVPRHDDARTFRRWWNAADRPAVDAVVGGPPCQPVSESGLNLGEGDPRWGWPWFLDAIDVTGAHVVILENVKGLVSARHAHLFRRILADLSDRGFDAEWSLISACSLGASHMRRRLFLVAYSEARGWRGGSLAVTREAAGWVEPAGSGGWAPEPGVGRMAHGGAERMDRIGALGDAVVPAVAERVGRLVTAAAGGGSSPACHLSAPRATT